MQTGSLVKIGGGHNKKPNQEDNVGTNDGILKQFIK